MEIFVLAEHRQGQIRDITFEMLTKSRELAEKMKADLTAILLGKNARKQAETLSEYASKVLLVEDDKLENFNSDFYTNILSDLIKKNNPILTMIGHTSFGVELAPRLAVALEIPLATDCIDLTFNGETFNVTRQMYGGKVNVEATMRESTRYMVTVRQATFKAEKSSAKGEIFEKQVSVTDEGTTKRVIKYLLPPPGGVDITTADVLIGVGRGIKDEGNLPLIEKLAEITGGALACSRPIVDKGWLSNDRQVGTSGKTVKPKLYIALGISGAFQHVLGMKDSDLIIAVNKDPNAPIFNFSDYGVVDDLLKIVPSLTNRIQELKG